MSFDIYSKDIVPMVDVTISMLYGICLCILHNALYESFLYWEVCYIYFLFRSDYATEPEEYICFY